MKSIVDERRRVTLPKSVRAGAVVEIEDVEPGRLILHVLEKKPADGADALSRLYKRSSKRENDEELKLSRRSVKP